MSTPYREPDFALGPVLVAGLVVLATARGSRARRAVGAALVVTEFAWPAYQEFKRRPHVPRLLAYNRTDENPSGSGLNASA